MSVQNSLPAEPQTAHVAACPRVLPSLPARILLSLKRRGLSGSALRMLDRVRNLAFDLRLGVDTRYRTAERERVMAGVSSDRVGHSHPWQPTSHRKVARALRSLSVDLSEFIFIDYGSGKGKALMVAARFPFKRIVGVEHSRELVEIARRNFLKVRSPRIRQSPVELICADAAAYRPPVAPTVYFLFNPFDQTVMTSVLARMTDVATQLKRPCFLIYDNPVCLRLMLATPGIRRRENQDEMAVLEIAPAGALNAN